MEQPRTGPRRDPSLPHQIVLSAGGTRNNNITVSCNCLLIKGRPGAGSAQPPSPDHYEPIAEVHNAAQSRDAYNDPTNHRLPFTDADKILLGVEIRP